MTKKVKLTGLVGARGKGVPDIFEGEVRIVENLYEFVPSKFPEKLNLVLIVKMLSSDVLTSFFRSDRIMAVAAIEGGITSHGMVIMRERIQDFEREMKDIEKNAPSVVAITSIIGDYGLLKEGDEVQVKITDSTATIILI